MFNWELADVDGVAVFGLPGPGWELLVAAELCQPRCGPGC